MAIVCLVGVGTARALSKPALSVGDLLRWQYIDPLGGPQSIYFTPSLVNTSSQSVVLFSLSLLFILFEAPDAISILI